MQQMSSNLFQGPEAQWAGKEETLQIWCRTSSFMEGKTIISSRFCGVDVLMSTAFCSRDPNVPSCLANGCSCSCNSPRKMRETHENQNMLFFLIILQGHLQKLGKPVQYSLQNQRMEVLAKLDMQPQRSLRTHTRHCQR